MISGVDYLLNSMIIFKYQIPIRNMKDKKKVVNYPLVHLS